MLFTDGSADNQSGTGFGAYLLVTAAEASLQQLRECVKVKRFDQTSSSRLELQTLLWALTEIQPLEPELAVYTDSQNIIGLPARRERLEQNDFLAKNQRCLSNAQLYREFYRLYDQMQIKLIKVRGHLPRQRKENIDRYFSLVDKAARNSLRNALQKD